MEDSSSSKPFHATKPVFLSTSPPSHQLLPPTAPKPALSFLPPPEMGDPPRLPRPGPEELKARTEPTSRSPHLLQTVLLRHLPRPRLWRPSLLSEEENTKFIIILPRTKNQPEPEARTPTAIGRCTKAFSPHQFSSPPPAAPPRTSLCTKQHGRCPR
ncbi:unnamed protein product, partial [Lampetra planeri]